MPVYLGGKRLEAIKLGSQNIARVYLGTKIVFDAGGQPAGTYILYNDGFVDGISWKGNYLPRPQYTSIGSYSFESTRMALTVASEPQYSAVNHNCHVCTSGLITVPSDAKKMKVRAIATDGQGSVSPYINFGLLTQDCVTSMSPANGGQLSGITDASAQKLTDYSMTLSSGIAGKSWIAVVNMRRNAQADNYCAVRIAKVWFE